MSAKKKTRTSKRKRPITIVRARRATSRAPSQPVSFAQPGLLPFLIALASTARGIVIDPRKAIPVTPRNLLSLPLNDRRIGLTSAAQVETLRSNLAQVLPQLSGSLAALPLTPNSVVADAANRVSGLLAAAPQGAAPAVFALGADAEARKKVENRWGRAFASKSSPALVRRLTAPTRELFSAAPQAAPAVVLEFVEQKPVAPEGPRAASRTQRLASWRDAFYKLASPVRVAIEKASGTPSVQLCWLNSTIRVGGQVAAVAGVADHDALEMLDVSRVLRREMNVAGATVHAAATRGRTGLTGNGVRVAVIDGEVNLGHPALVGRVTLQENFTGESFGSPDPHGTAVAGIIAARDDTFSGIAPDALVVNYKVFATGETSGDEFQGMLAIEHALRDGIDIANCSWGIGPTGDGTDRNAKAFNKAWQEGLVLVKSAGNDGPDPNTMTAPADADGVIVVGATEREGTAVQDYSSRGPTTNGKRPHLVAPGGTDAINMATCLSAAAGGFGDVGFGTSLAAPIVSGAAALVRQQLPTATPDDVRTRLQQICAPLANVDADLQGAGVLDLNLF